MMNTAAMSDETILAEIEELECEDEELEVEIINCERQREEIAAGIATLRATLEARDAAAYADATDPINRGI
jgi:chaperonin cofactor prefoldin